MDDKESEHYDDDDDDNIPLREKLCVFQPFVQFLQCDILLQCALLEA